MSSSLGRAFPEILYNTLCPINYIFPVCGDGIDEVVDFDPAEGDVMAGNCELF